MKLKNIFLYALSCAILMGFTGCAKYRARSLKTLTKSSRAEENSIAFSYKKFSVSDCKRYLGRNTIAKGYQPIQITFTNNTNRYLSISKKSLSLDCVSVKEVAKRVHTNTVGRAVGYSVAGLFVWPFFIPAIVDGIGSAKANEQLDADFAEKALYKQIVQPYTTINGIVFIACEDDFDENFTVTVSDQKNNHFILSPDKPKLRI